MQAEQPVRISFDGEQLLEVKRVATHDRPYAARVSLAFALRLMEGVATRTVCSFAVLEAMGRLEGIGRWRHRDAGEPFKHSPLAPFWHTHFVSARHIGKNLAIRWGFEHGGNRFLRDALFKTAKRCGDSDAWPSYLADWIVMGGFSDRAKEGLTGDWIVFGKHEGLNYYLDLATHHEGEPEHAAQLLKKLKNGSIAEFPFVFAGAS